MHSWMNGLHVGVTGLTNDRASLARKELFDVQACPIKLSSTSAKPTAAPAEVTAQHALPHVYLSACCDIRALVAGLRRMHVTIRAQPANVRVEIADKQHPPMQGPGCAPMHPCT